eukprot:4387935-Pleurochrysis_carterae.AAC.4
MPATARRARALARPHIRARAPTSLQCLSRDALDPRQGEVRIGVPVEHVQVIPKQLRHYEQMLAVVEKLDQSQDTLFTVRVIPVEVLQDLDLAEGLVEKVLVVVHHFDADRPVSPVLGALHRVRKGARAKLVHHRVLVRDGRAGVKPKVDALFKLALARVGEHGQVDRDEARRRLGFGANLAAVRVDWARKVRLQLYRPKVA